ncbi:MAG TPA: hypothetical protein VK447_16225 [Myxococcaceae bacterium]|nr:hypothetical protein [Myxococcaceae bacterium]
MTTTRPLGALPLIAAALLGACGPPQVVKVTEREYELSLDQGAVSPGEVTFTVTNAGRETHDAAVFMTELPADGLPVVTAADNTTRIDVGSSELTRLTPQVEAVLPGGTKSATLKLGPGKYVVVCDAPDHYRSGMHAALSVK